MNGADRQEVKDVLRVALRRLVIATVVLYVALFSVVVWVYVSGTAASNAIAETTEQTNTALCALRSDLETRVASSREFLEENPEGIPGISARVIRDGIENQERTIDALSGLECEEAVA